MHEQHEESKDSLSMLKSNYHTVGGQATVGQIFNAATNYNASQSFFLNTNASIFERNPFQDFTASKINALFNANSQNSASASQKPQTAVSKPGIDQLIQVREDALKFITQLEKGWIAR